MEKINEFVENLSEIAIKDNNKELLSKLGEIKGILLAYEMINDVELLKKMISLLCDLTMLVHQFNYNNITKISNIKKASNNVKNREGELAQFYIYLTNEGKKETTADAYRKTVNQIIKELNESKELILNGLEDFEVKIDEILEIYIKKDFDGELKDNGRRISTIKQYKNYLETIDIDEIKMFDASQMELIKGYRDYLRDEGYAESSIKMYSRRIKNFFKNGYSVNDLIGSLNNLIVMYSNGGTHFDPKEHGTTSNALKRLADYLGV